MASQVPSATVAASPAVNSAWMIRLGRTVLLLPYMSIAASRLTFAPAWSHAGVNARVCGQAAGGAKVSFASMTSALKKPRSCLAAVVSTRATAATSATPGRP
jgi:hypothetical protein